MQRFALTLLVGALLVSTSCAASVFQLDVCNKHRTVSEAPGMSLTFTKDGMCVVTSQVLTIPAGDPKSCRGTKTSTAVLLRFPCTEEPRQKQASGPALNLWGSFDGIPTPTRSGVVVTEAGPVSKKHSLHATKLSGHSTTPNGYAVSSTTPAGYVVSSSNAPAAAAAAAAAAPEGYVVSGASPSGYVVSGTDTPATTAGYVVSSTPASTSDYVVSSTSANTSSSSTVGACSFLTLNPGLYYHKSPPMFTYGYVVSGVPCERAASALAATSALERQGARTFPTTYSLWMKPTLPAPPAGISTEPQMCNIVVSVLTRSYVSTEKFPCRMQTLSPPELEEGCCYNAGGNGRRLSGWWAGRGLLSDWEKGVWTRRAMLHW